MKLTQKQQEELESIKEFIPDNCKWGRITPRSIEMYFEWGDHGKHKKRANMSPYKFGCRSGFQSLVWGKIWRMRHIQMYEDWFLQDNGGWCGYKELFKDMSKGSILFFARSMFRGLDKDLIIANCL